MERLIPLVLTMIFGFIFVAMTTELRPIEASNLYNTAVGLSLICTIISLITTGVVLVSNR